MGHLLIIFDEKLAKKLYMKNMAKLDFLVLIYLAPIPPSSPNEVQNIVLDKCINISAHTGPGIWLNHSKLEKLVFK